MTEQPQPPPPPEPTHPRALVQGEFVQYGPGKFVRADKVRDIEGGEATTYLTMDSGEQPGGALVSHHPAHTILAALNLALERGRERIAVTPRD
jgi:hypothetical protein